MIEPIQSLAFSVQANPKVYALLLGSGVSRSAEIPTGWQIVMDLLGKLAASLGETDVTNLEEWYVRTYKEAPDYSKLLDALAKTASERQQLLRPYIEANDEQRQEGLKQPTAAHRAIARLVAQGFIKIIVTTNFDRLLEKALEDEGIVPTILSTADQVAGALPLDHIKCCIFKVHGDYLDPQIRNTQSELDVYPQAYNSLLDRIFDEYGLIVCGWSGSWDTALRNAFFRAKSRRFTTYWALHGEANDEARRLIEHRSAQVFPIDNADYFFQHIQQTVTSIEEYARPHPLSTEAAVASLKRYLSGPEYRIQLLDLIDTTVEQVVRGTTSEEFSVGAPTPEKTTIMARLRRYESSGATLLSMAALGGYWANEENFTGWDRGLEQLATKNLQLGSSYRVWNCLKTYPGLLLLYALGLGALETNHLHIVNRVFRRVAADSSSGTSQPVNVLTILLTNRNVDGLLKGMLEGMERNYLPVNDRLHDVLRQPLKQIIANDGKYTLMFDKFEMLAALAFTSMRNQNSLLEDWFPPGAYMYRTDNRQSILSEIENSISSLGDLSAYVTSGIFGDNASDCLHLIERFKKAVPKIAMRMGIFY